MKPETIISAVRAWFSDWEPRWRSIQVEPLLILPTAAQLSKVVVTLDGSSHAASVTVWGGGTLEFIVLDIAAQQEAVMADHEFGTVDELRHLLEDSAESFRRILGP